MHVIVDVKLIFSYPSYLKKKKKIISIWHSNTGSTNSVCLGRGNLCVQPMADRGSVSETWLKRVFTLIFYFPLPFGDTSGAKISLNRLFFSLLRTI